MKRKKVAHRKPLPAKKKRQTNIRYFKISYVIIGAIVVALLFSVDSLSQLNSPQSVLGASTSNQSSMFSFDTFFNSIFSFFTFGLYHPNQSLTNSGNNGNVGSNQNNSGNTANTLLAATNKTQTTLTQDQLLAMAGTKYADGVLPLGDNKYVTDNPKVGYIYLCRVMQGGGGAQSSGSWLGTSTWNEQEKPTVQGSVSWPNATFSNTVSGNTRTLTGNGLPVGVTTGTFPVSSSDPASKYDANPNSIKTQTLNLTLPTNPSYSDTPSCMGGEVGVMLDGVPLFNGFDEEMRDAPAHEIQDSCDGHPQSSGEYHYHSMSSCISSNDVQTVIGFALDGFPITGSVVADGKYLTTENLDECHGITSEITLDGKQVTMYHYVMTKDFPYSASCFRGKPVNLQVISGGQGQKGRGGSGSRPSGMPSGMMGGQQGQEGQSRGQHQPPQAAFSACSGQSTGASCSFSGQQGTISGTCQTPPGQSSSVCVPANSNGGQMGGQEQNGGGQLPGIDQQNGDNSFLP